MSVSTSTSSILDFSLTPQEQYELTERVQDTSPDFDPLHTHASTIALLYAWGYVQLGLAYLYCGRQTAGDLHACGNVTNRYPVFCRKPGCECSEHEFEKAVKFLTSCTRAIAKDHPDWLISWVEVHIPSAPDPESTKLAKERFKQSFLSLIPGAESAYLSNHAIPQDVHCVVAGRSDSGDLVLRAQTYSPTASSLAEIRAAFPYATRVTPAVVSMSELPKFIGFLLKPIVNRTPQGMAECAVALDGIRKLDSLGCGLRSNSNAEKLQTDTISSVTSPQDDPPKPPKLCPFCRAAFVKRVIIDDNRSYVCPNRFNMRMLN